MDKTSTSFRILGNHRFVGDNAVGDHVDVVGDGNHVDLLAARAKLHRLIVAVADDRFHSVGQERLNLGEADVFGGDGGRGRCPSP